MHALTPHSPVAIRPHRTVCDRGQRCSPPSLGSSRACKAAAQQQETVSKGLSLLEWTNKLLPQSTVVSVVKQGWRLAWQIMVRELAPQSKDGAYKRPSYKFTGRIGTPEFPAESGRYHVYLGNACPWCHRVYLTLVLRGLLKPQAVQAQAAGSQSQSSQGPQQPAQHQETGRPGSSQGSSQGNSLGSRQQGHVSITQLADDPTRARRGGWVFDASDPDPVWGAQDLWEVYDSASPGFKGRCTAPLLVDKVTRRIVSNESADIMRMLNTLHLPDCTSVDLVPEQLRSEIDALNEQMYESINNGVYRSGFSTSQAAYDAVQQELFQALDAMELRLSRSRFLLGDLLTEADLRLFPTIVRFDAVYAIIFRCCKRRISDYPHLQSWMRDMWQLEVPGSLDQVRDTVDIDAARRSYFGNLFPLNASGIIPSGPTAADLQLDQAHRRGQGGKVAEALAHVRDASAPVLSRAG
ncbi:putative glutathione S-transferase [Haematococcus lacustris]